MLCGSYRKEVLAEVKVNDKIMQIAEKIKDIDKEKRLGELKTMLIDAKTEFGNKFSFALDSRIQVKDFYHDKCKILDSKKLPLWLNMMNSQSDAPNILLIYKTGDDLRQDLLTIQLIRIMDKIWLDNGYDFRMKPYKVISTMDQVGMIEVVLNSETTSSIHSESGRLGALKSDTIMVYLRKHNPKPE